MPKTRSANASEIMAAGVGLDILTNVSSEHVLRKKSLPKFQRSETLWSHPSKPETPRPGGLRCLLKEVYERVSKLMALTD